MTLIAVVTKQTYGTVLIQALQHKAAGMLPLFAKVAFVFSKSNFLFFIVYNESADTNCTDGSVRLVGGINELDGSVEICYNNFWGAVCHDRWTNNDAEIVCTQLGHRTIGIEWQISSLICILYITIYRSHCFYWQLLWA